MANVTVTPTGPPPQCTATPRSRRPGTGCARLCQTVTFECGNLDEPPPLGCFRTPAGWHSANEGA